MMKRKFAWLSLALAFAGCQFGDDPRASQRQARCGDKIVDVSEGCDDGNTTSGDGCSATCAVETPNPVCGNNKKEQGEECDDGNVVNGDGCSSACKAEGARCGNGSREGNEACDDGNTTAGDGCSATCESEVRCGDGTKTAGEECDDGNTTSGDGCSSTCTVETAVCDLVPNDGCAANEACDLDDQHEHACRAKGTRTTEVRCSADTECAAGYTCVDYGGTGYCTRYCATDGHCTGSGAACEVDLEDQDDADGLASLCTFACDPVADTGCPGALSCHTYEDSARDYTQCVAAGTKQPGTACTADDQCDGGAACVESNGGASVCRDYCQVGNNATCPTGQTCTTFNPELKIGNTIVGACI